MPCLHVKAPWRHLLALVVPRHLHKLVERQRRDAALAQPLAVEATNSRAPSRHKVRGKAHGALRVLREVVKRPAADEAGGKRAATGEYDRDAILKEPVELGIIPAATFDLTLDEPPR